MSLERPARTLATTGRGLYVSMTRGRHDNTALVVTGEATIEAAADVLTGVLASDRTDNPAIAQRRELAQQIPPMLRAPQRQPRCQIPDWWHTLRTDTQHAVAGVRAELETTRTERNDRADRQVAAHTEAQRATAALDPYRQPYAIASSTLRRAETAHSQARKVTADQRTPRPTRRTGATRHRGD